MTLWDKGNIIYHIAELEGDQEGKYIHSGTKMTALIPLIQKKLSDLENMFAEHKKNRIKQGFNPSDIMPKEMMNEFYTLHARLFVYETEVEFLKKQLSEFVEKEEAESDSKVLIYGLQGYGKLSGGVLSTIDGQKVEEIDGIMVIVDKRSPYHGMSVPDYRELTRQWQADRKEADRQKLLRLQDEARAKGNLIPKQLPVQSPHKVSRASLLAWPTGVRNYLKEKKRVRIGN
jgi:hypothetical protein